MSLEGGSTETELKRLVESMGLGRGFLGLFDCRFPGFIQKHKIQTAIVNTGPREGGGLHWIAMAWNPTRRVVYLFDPLGWTESDLSRYYGFSYRNMIKRSALSSPDRCVTLERNTQAVQCTCSGSCGLWCVYFLAAFLLNPNDPFETKLFQDLQGKAPQLHPSSPATLHRNQEILYRYLHAHSVYFRTHSAEITRRTRAGLIKTH